MFYSNKRIKAHLCIAFVAYSVWKELETVLKAQGMEISPKRAGELTHRMYALDYILPRSKKFKRKILGMDSEQQDLYWAVNKK